MRRRRLENTRRRLLALRRKQLICPFQLSLNSVISPNFDQSQGLLLAPRSTSGHFELHRCACSVRFWHAISFTPSALYRAVPCSTVVGSVPHGTIRYGLAFVHMRIVSMPCRAKPCSARFIRSRLGGKECLACKTIMTLGNAYRSALNVHSVLPYSL